MPPQVKRAVPSAWCLLFLAAHGLLSVAEVSFSCNTGSRDNVKLSPSFYSSYLSPMAPSHLPFHSAAPPSISPSGWTYTCYASRVWKSITSSQHCLNFQLTTLRSVSPDASITTAQPLRAAAQTQQLSSSGAFTITQPNTPLCAKHRSAAVWWGCAHEQTRLRPVCLPCNRHEPHPSSEIIGRFTRNKSFCLGTLFISI